MSQEASIDALNHEMFEAFAESGCPLCRLRSMSEQRIVRHLSRDVMYEPAMREELLAAGGLCYRHARYFHELVAEGGSGAEIACVYGGLVDRDLSWLGELANVLGTRRRSRLAKVVERRPSGCYACRRLGTAERRHTEQLLELLDDAATREAYATSDGICVCHVLRAAGDADLAAFAPGALRFAVEDAHRRLLRLREELAEFDRKRDPSLATERTAEEERSLSRVIRRYVGQRPAPGEIPWDPGLADW